jgi:hypothetical protein
MHAGRKRRPDRAKQGGRTTDFENVAPGNRHGHLSCQYSSDSLVARSGTKKPLALPLSDRGGFSGIAVQPSAVSGSGSVVGATR